MIKLRDIEFVHFCPRCSKPTLMIDGSSQWPMESDADNNYWLCTDCNTGWLLSDDFVRKLVRAQSKPK